MPRYAKVEEVEGGFRLVGKVYESPRKEESKRMLHEVKLDICEARPAKGSTDSVLFFWVSLILGTLISVLLRVFITTQLKEPWYQSFWVLLALSAIVAAAGLAVVSFWAMRQKVDYRGTTTGSLNLETKEARLTSKV